MIERNNCLFYRIITCSARRGPVSTVKSQQRLVLLRMMSRR